MAYFGTDQSQVQRYLSGKSIAESRMGLLFNGAVKIPMQLLILFVGVMVFVYYQFNQPPIFFNQAELARVQATDSAEHLHALESQHQRAFDEKRDQLWRLDRALKDDDAPAVAAAEVAVRQADARATAIREQAKSVIVAAVPKANTKDADYVFLSFVTQNLPRGVVGLLLAVILCAAMSAVAGELSALATTTVVDFYKRSVRPQADDAHYVRAARWFTAGWGVLALLFATFASLLDNLIQAVNILGSLFYGTVLGIFLTAFFLRKVGGTVVCAAAIVSELMVLALFKWSHVSFLWYNVVGCAAVVGIAGVLTALARASQPARAR
jgi:Na+/proline symporter